MQSPPFVVIFPGFPVMTNFMPTDDTMMKFSIQVPLPHSVTEFALSLSDPTMLPPEHGVAVYYAQSPDYGWQYIGMLHAGQPSAIFAAPWHESEGWNSAGTTEICIGLSIEHQSFLVNLADSSAIQERSKYEIACAVAQHAYNFIMSFASPLNEVVCVPQKALNTWIDKFQNNMRLDPAFLKRVKRN
jgi:hypothetical protein